jgi:hypothetical protein
MKWENEHNRARDIRMRYGLSHYVDFLWKNEGFREEMRMNPLAVVEFQLKKEESGIPSIFENIFFYKKISLSQLLT